MKKKIWIALLAVVLLMGAYAGISLKPTAQGTGFAISIPDKKVVKDQEFIMEIKLKSDMDLQSVDVYIVYDQEKTEFMEESQTAEIKGAAGIIHIESFFDNPVKQKIYKVKMKAIGIGNATFSVQEGYAEFTGVNGNKELEKTEAAIEIGVNKEKSTDTTLSSLQIYPGDLTPIFESTTTEYEVKVEDDIDGLIISAVPADEGSVVTVIGNEKFTVGENEVVIKVISASGAKQDYMIKVIKE